MRDQDQAPLRSEQEVLVVFDSIKSHISRGDHAMARDAEQFSDAKAYVVVVIEVRHRYHALF